MMDRRVISQLRPWHIPFGYNFFRVVSPRAAFVKQFPLSRDSKIPLRRINSDIFVGVHRRHAFGACRFYYRLYSNFFFFLFTTFSYRVSQSGDKTMDVR